MVFKGKLLILDNIRSELKGYSVDIQDIVRSAILDGVDISNYIDLCVDNPYRLDQIRLCMKEGIDEGYYQLLDGNTIYRIRSLFRRNMKVPSADMLVTLSKVHIQYILKWIEKGYKFSSLNISIIPRTLLPIFEYGISNGYDMKPFNNGINYTSEYIKLCLRIISNKKFVKTLMGGRFEISCLKLLCSFSEKCSIAEWSNLMLCVDEGVSCGRLRLLIDCVSFKIPVSGINARFSDGNYVFNDLHVGIIIDAYKNGYDYKKLLDTSLCYDDALAMYDDMKLKTGNSVKGKLLKSRL